MTGLQRGLGGIIEVPATDTCAIAEKVLDELLPHPGGNLALSSLVLENRLCPLDRGLCDERTGGRYCPTKHDGGLRVVIIERSQRLSHELLLCLDRSKLGHLIELRAGHRQLM